MQFSTKDLQSNEFDLSEPGAGIGAADDAPPAAPPGPALTTEQQQQLQQNVSTFFTRACVLS